MEFRVHVVVLGVLVVYTVVMVLLVARNIHALRTHHACSDVSTPLSKAFATLLDAPDAKPESIVRAVSSSGFSAVRIMIFDAEGSVLCDTHDTAPKTQGASPNESQHDARAAIDAAPGQGSTKKISKLMHYHHGTHMTHLTGTRCKNGKLVVTEAIGENV